MKQLLREEESPWIEDMLVKEDAYTQRNVYHWSAVMRRSSANNNQLSVFSTYCSGERGFTLIELLIVVLVAAVLLVFAIPSFEGVINNNRVASATNELTTTLARARLAAIKANTNSEVKPTTGTDWSAGYQIEADLNGDSINEVVSIVEAVEDNVSFVGSSALITFNSLGGLGSTLYPSSATFTETFTLNAPKAYGRILNISASGSTSVKVNPNTN